VPKISYFHPGLLGVNTKFGGSLLVMAIIGGAVLTPVMGLISETFRSLAVAYLVPLVAYAFVAYYGFSGSKLRFVAVAGNRIPPISSPPTKS
jgi:fucose permease